MRKTHQFYCMLLLFLLFGVNGGMSFSIWSSFKLNQSSIAISICEKKMETSNSCQGKCHLKKQLEQIVSMNKEDPSDQKQTLKSSFKWFFIQNIVLTSIISRLTTSDSFQFYLTKYPNQGIPPSTPPPQVLFFL